MNDNKKRINNEQELFELFCDPYSNRKQLQKPYYEKSTKTVYATEGHVGLIFPRSSIRDKDLSLTNSVGVIDSGYRGEITACFRVHPFEDGSVAYYDAGERFAQLIILPIPAVEFIEVEELNDNTDRGANGYGSSGK